MRQISQYQAKTLRGEVVAILNRSTHAPQRDNPTRMLHGESVVTVALSKDEKCKDVSVARMRSTIL